MKSISIEWIRHLKTKQEQEEFEKSLRHTTEVLSRLRTIVEEKIQSVDREEISSSSYENPAWAYKQAHANGERAGLTKVLQLLAFLES